MIYVDRELTPEEIEHNSRLLDEIGEIMMHEEGWFLGNAIKSIFNKQNAELIEFTSELQWTDVND